MFCIFVNPPVTACAVPPLHRAGMGFKQICGLHGFAEDIFDFLPRFFLLCSGKARRAFLCKNFT